MVKQQLPSLIIALLLSVFLALAVPVEAQAIGYGSGTYTNLCGTGTSATAHTCQQGCNTQSGSCSSSGNTVVKYVCDGNQSECRQNESSFSSSQSLGGTPCGKTVQIDVFSKTCRNSNGGWDCGSSDLRDYIVWYSGNCSTSATPRPTPTPTPRPTPTPTPRPTPTPTATPALVSCQDLIVTDGNNRNVPAIVSFKTQANSATTNTRYRYFFGDGQNTETNLSEIKHTYETSGNFTARVELKEGQGSWQTSTSCETRVAVKASAVESHRSGCSDLFIEANNGSQAPTTVKFKINGFDNKGDIQQYRLDYGNGVVKESAGQTFEQRYETAGTFTVKAYVRDSQGNWQGGSSSCQKTVYVSTKPLERQPTTGTPTWFTISAVVAGSLGGLALFMRPRLQPAVAPKASKKSRRNSKK